MAVAATWSERRAFGRRQTHIEASVRTGGRALSCIIRDLSEGGALLEFPGPVEIKGRMWLSWPAHGDEVVAEIRHMRGAQCGVEFARPISLAGREPMAPVHAPLAAPAPAPQATGRAASDLVADRRRALRLNVLEAAAAEPPPQTMKDAVVATRTESEPPRDMSVFLNARDAVAPAPAADLPREMSAALFALPPQAGVSVPLPLAAAAYALAGL